MKYPLFICLFLTMSAPVSARDIEAEARAIGHTIRCMVCEGQSIEESHASLADDMRRYIRAELEAGRTSDAIVAQLRDRYGDSVSLLPPVKPVTWPLWVFPPAMLFAGFLFLRRQAFARRRKARR